MGGRGAFSGGNGPFNNAKLTSYEFKTINQIGNIKIVEHIANPSKMAMPTFSKNPNDVYAILKSGNIHQIRLFGENRTPLIDIDVEWHNDLFIHAHDWNVNSSTGTIKRDEPRKLTNSEIKIYTYFKGGIENG